MHISKKIRTTLSRYTINLSNDVRGTTQIKKEYPKFVIYIAGGTGCGKTRLARTIADLYTKGKEICPTTQTPHFHAYI